MCTTVFVLSLVGRHIACFHFLVIMNTAMGISVQDFGVDMCFHFSWANRSRIDRVI